MRDRFWLFRKRFEASSSPFCLTHALGLAGFSHKLDKDPWNQEKNLNGKGILCAHLEGGTVIYMCPEQLWVIRESKKIDKAADQPLYLALKDRWQITPATSDMSQVSLTVLEMHARTSRWFGPGAVSWLEAVRECASRVSSSVVCAMTPAEAEQWAVETLGIDKLTGKIESSGINGAKMLELSKMSLSDAKKAHPGMSPVVYTKLKGVARGVSTSADAMPEEIAALLEKTLAVDVGERPATADAALELLGANDELNMETFKFETDFSVAVGGATVPSMLWTAMAKAKEHPEETEHPDETVAATLGGLAKTLVIHNDVAGALAACSEWWGVASSPEASNAAAEAYRNLWKRHGTSLRRLDLSRTARGHWKESMMSGEETVLRLAQDVVQSGASMIETVDFSEQTGLQGPVLETLFSVCASSLSKLLTLKLGGCRSASGLIPASICTCLMLQTLDLHGCGFSGALSIRPERVISC